MPDELDTRLANLSPVVDTDGALSAFRGRRWQAARRRQLARVAIPVVLALVVGGVAVVVARQGDDPQSVDAVDDPLELRDTVVTDQGIEVTITAPVQAVAGTRVAVDVHIRNVGDREVYWEAGGCAIPAAVAIQPTSLDDQLYEPDDRPPEPRWSGDPAELSQALQAHNALPDRQAQQPAGSTGRRSEVCNSNSQPTPLAMGGNLDADGTVEVRVPDGPLPDEGRYEVAVQFLAALDASTPPQAPGSDRIEVTARADLTVVDDPARGHGDATEALEAMAADPRLVTWVDQNSLPDRPDLEQSYSVELSWWRGAWELWIEPYWAGDRRLRIRYDSAAGEVVDVRTVYLGVAPADEPGRASDDHPPGVADELEDEVL